MKRRRRGKRIQAGLQDGKTFALYRAARDLLAENDFDSVSMSRFAKVAGISVGAFYGRFESKKAFLLFLIRETFLQMARRAEKDWDILLAQKISREKSTQKIAENIAAQFLDSENAGIIRAAIKLGFSEPRAREYFEDYRENIAERAAEILAPGGKRSGKDASRASIQCLFGLLTDHIVYSRGNILLAESRIKQGLAGFIAGYSRNKPSNKTTNSPDSKPRIKNKPDNKQGNKIFPETIKYSADNIRENKSSMRRFKPDAKSPKDIFDAPEKDAKTRPANNRRKPRLL